MCWATPSSGSCSRCRSRIRSSPPRPPTRTGTPPSSRIASARDDGWVREEPRMRARIALICSLTVAGLVALLGTPAHAGTTFVVNNTAASGAGSLHDAILGSNALKSVDTIDFAIATSGVQTITSPLLAITDPVVIDGTTEPGYAVGFPTVWIVGSGSGVGLEVDASGSTIKGLGIGGFFEGIQLSG